jgi:ribosome-associated heat shock protein Hsp15
VESIRVDKWLAAARIFKSRTAATDACADGTVWINGSEAKASHLVKVGDEVVALAPRGKVVLDVLRLEEKRLSAPKAAELYTDRSPPPPPREELFPSRERGMGRPTKHDRRELQRVRGR